MRKAIRKILGYFGYDFIKVKRTQLYGREHKVQVGKYSLTMPSINPLINVYRDEKDFASEIGRIMLCVYEKYPRMHFVDVGANTGDTAAIIKSLKSIPVVSIEGDPFTFSYLKRNAELFEDIKILNHYLGEKDQAMNISFEKEGWNTTLIPAEGKGKKVDLVTLDSLLGGLGEDLSFFKLLKIDTEGFDTIILRGASGLISKTKPVIYIEYNRDNMEAIGENGLSSLLQLERSGYNKVLFFDDRGRYILSTTLSEKRLVSDLHNYADGKNGLIYYYNICFFHSDDDDIAERLAENESARVTK